MKKEARRRRKDRETIGWSLFGQLVGWLVGRLQTEGEDIRGYHRDIESQFGFYSFFLSCFLSFSMFYFVFLSFSFFLFFFLFLFYFIFFSFSSFLRFLFFVFFVFFHCFVDCFCFDRSTQLTQLGNDIIVISLFLSRLVNYCILHLKKKQKQEWKLQQEQECKQENKQDHNKNKNINKKINKNINKKINKNTNDSQKRDSAICCLIILTAFTVFVTSLSVEDPVQQQYCLFLFYHKNIIFLYFDDFSQI